MADAAASSVEAAWKALWREGGRYHLPTAVERGLTTAKVRLPPLRVVRLDDVGPLTLFNKAPWNGVAIWLTRNRLAVVVPVREVAFRYDEASRRVRAELAFPKLAYSAHYLIRSGVMPGSAIRAAAEPLGLGGDGNGNVQLANQYQDNLLSSDNGITLVGTYWDNNEAYNYVFTNSTVLQNQWTSTETPPGSGQNTRFFADQTNSAAQPGLASPPPVQGSVSSNGYSHYAAHSLLMQNFVWQTCLAYADHEPDTSSQFAAAGAVSSQFLAATQNYVGTPMTVPSVMSTVAGANQAAALAAGRRPRPAWQDEIERQGREFRKKVEAEIKATRGYRLPLHHSRRTPARGTVAVELGLERVSFEGTLRPGGPDGHPSVQFGAAAGGDLSVELRLSPFDGPLHDEVKRSLAEAHFLKDALGQRIGAAVGGARMAGYLGSLMNLALAGELGPV